MRIIGTIPHPKIMISVFSMNDKYQIKFEAGSMEQVYKVRHDEINGLEGVYKLVDEEFIQKVTERFNEMFLTFKEAKQRYSN